MTNSPLEDENPSENKELRAAEAGLDRRTIIKAAVIAPIALVEGMILNDVWAPGRTLVGSLLQKIYAQESIVSVRRDLLAKIFAENGITQMIPGASNPLQPGLHPDDRWTMERLGRMFGGERVICDEGDFSPAPEANYICLGSPQSNAVSMEQLRYERKPDESVAPIRDDRAGPVYHLAIDYEYPPLPARVPMIRRYVGGKVVERPLYQFWLRAAVSHGSSSSTFLKHNRCILPGWNEGGWLSEDWLLVTRVPSLRYKGYYTTVLGGMYGTGTKGGADLMQRLPVAQLRELDAQREGAFSFQSLFRVSVEHRHGEVRGSGESLVKAIQHIQTFPLDIGGEAPGGDER